MPSYQPRIAIIGAGPAGLTLGVLLHRNGVPFTIYELRQRPTDDDLLKPSGMLDLHEDSGLAVIRSCGLFDKFKPLTAECAQSTIISDKDGNVLHEDGGMLQGRPEISRHALIRLLLSALPDETIQWDQKLLSVTSSGADPAIVSLDFGPAGTAKYDLVIGADGAWSKVRSLLSSEKPRSSGLMYYTLTITHITEKRPDLAELVGKGTMFALGTTNALISQRSTMDSARLAVAINAKDESAPHVAKLAGLPTSQLKKHLLSDEKLFGLWSPKMKELLALACDEEVSRNSTVEIKDFSMLPVGHRWKNKAGVTLIGDAAHLMTPFAGEGVNLAMWDALDLAGVILKAIHASYQDSGGFQKAITPHMEKFEDKMLWRAKPRADESWNNCSIVFSDDGAKVFADLFSISGIAKMIAKKIYIEVCGFFRKI